MARITRTATITVLAVLLVAASLGLLPGVTSPAEGAGDLALEHAPAEGPTGTAISIEGQGCLLPDSEDGADGVIVVLETDAGEALA